MFDEAIFKTSRRHKEAPFSKNKEEGSYRDDFSPLYHPFSVWARLVSDSRFRYSLSEPLILSPCFLCALWMEASQRGARFLFFPLLPTPPLGYLLICFSFFVSFAFSLRSDVFLFSYSFFVYGFLLGLKKIPRANLVGLPFFDSCLLLPLVARSPSTPSFPHPTILGWYDPPPPLRRVASVNEASSSGVFSLQKAQ